MPYNRALNYSKHMEFKEDNHKISKWKKLSEFVLNENQQVLRKSLIQINNALYVEFENVTKWAMNRMNKLKLVRSKFEESQTKKYDEKFNFEKLRNLKTKRFTSNNVK